MSQHKERSPGRIAVYTHKGFGQEKTQDRILPFATPTEIEDRGCFLSNWGRFGEHSSEYEKPAHCLTPLTYKFDLAIVLRGAIPLPPSSALAAIFAEILIQMGEGSCMLVSTQGGWVTADFVKKHLPSVSVEDCYEGHEDWMRVDWSPRLQEDADSVHCIYSALSRNLEAFSDHFGMWRHEIKTNTAPGSTIHEFTSMFPASMHRALLAAHVFDLVLATFGCHGPMTGIDVGGGYGFFACELAVRGHRVMNLEPHPSIEIEPFLSEMTGTTDHVLGVAKPMQLLDTCDGKGSHDFVSFMGCLSALRWKKCPRFSSRQ